MLKDYLNSKPLYYDEIDYTRMPRIYEKIKTIFNLPKVIHLIGTNGKGTTGRFLASALFSIGYSVGHYTSPHILKFNERIWLNGNDIKDDVLELAHIKLQALLSKDDLDSLSYFEYTTFLAMIIYENCDYIVLEAGLGGEYDATAVFKKDLTLVTPIDFDHEAFLGDSIEKISTTKLKAIQNNAILGYQKHKEVFEIASNMKKNLYKVDELLSKKDLENILSISNHLSLPIYLEDNLKLSISALKFLEIDYNVKDFYNSRLFGRLSKLDENIYIDVGHNILASKSILESLNGDKYILIYNSYKDKNYMEILRTLSPIVESVEILEIVDDRIESNKMLENRLDKLNLRYTKFNKIKKNKKYLVFGSFKVVENFLKIYYE